MTSKIGESGEKLFSLNFWKKYFSQVHGYEFGKKKMLLMGSIWSKYAFCGVFGQNYIFANLRTTPEITSIVLAPLDSFSFKAEHFSYETDDVIFPKKLFHFFHFHKISYFGPFYPFNAISGQRFVNKMGQKYFYRIFNGKVSLPSQNNFPHISRENFFTWPPPLGGPEGGQNFSQFAVRLAKITKNGSNISPSSFRHIKNIRRSPIILVLWSLSNFKSI